MTPCLLAALESFEARAVVRLLVAAGLGALIGLERQQHGRAAGLRTQLLVSMGAAIAMLVSLYFGEVYGSDPLRPQVAVDPARVAYGVMGGVGFLGAGAILHYRTGIRGLTTAASLWCSAAVGLAAGFGMYLIAGAATGIVLFALVVLDWVGDRIAAKVYSRLTLTVADTSTEMIERCRRVLGDAGGKVVGVGHDRDFAHNRAVITFTASFRRATPEQAVDRLHEAVPEITNIRVE